MSGIKVLLAIILLLFLISLFHIPKASSKPAGFSLNLIRAYSPVSSLSNRNITFLERYKSYVQASKARASYWASFNKSIANKTIHPDMIRPPLTKEGETIVIEMRIGGPPQIVYLIFDTGGLNSWTQCASCTTCFSQSTKKFDPQLSGSYGEMSSNDLNCNPPLYIKNGGQCLFKSVYIKNQYTKGIASYDTFSSLNNNLHAYTRSIRFGCSLESAGLGLPPNTILSGVLGMSRHAESFPSQLGQRDGKGRFSYCLVDINTTPNAVNKVTFGDDIPNIPEDHLKTVPLVTSPYSRYAWAINLVDISVGEERLNLPPRTFAPNPNGGNGGLILDTGAAFTYLTKVAYRAIVSKIQEHLLKRHGHFTQISDQEDLCYRYNRPSRRLLMDYLQTITFHLEDFNVLDMRVTSVYRFNWADNTFCLGMVEAPSDHWPNILGSLQQQDTRFVYDLNRNSLFFTPETCVGWFSLLLTSVLELPLGQQSNLHQKHLCTPISKTLVVMFSIIFLEELVT